MRQFTAIYVDLFKPFNTTTRKELAVLPDLQTYLISVDITETMNSAIRYSATMLVLFPPTFILGEYYYSLNLKLYCGELKRDA